jgi:hypothetical protein
MTKKNYERATKRSISMPEILADKAEQRMREIGVYQFSDYIQRLVHRDVQAVAQKELPLERH